MATLGYMGMYFGLQSKHTFYTTNYYICYLNIHCSKYCYKKKGKIWYRIGDKFNNLAKVKPFVYLITFLKMALSAHKQTCTYTQWHSELMQLSLHAYSFSFNLTINFNFLILMNLINLITVKSRETILINEELFTLLKCEQHCTSL